VENENFNRMPLIGDEAPAFKARTTQGDINFRKIIRENG